MPAGGRAFLCFTVSAAGYLSAISFLVARLVFLSWRALAVVVRGLWPLLDGTPQLLVLTRRLPSEVLDAGRNGLHLSLDRGHGRVSTGPVIGSSFHNCGQSVYGPFCSKNNNSLLSRSHRWCQLITSKISEHGHILTRTDGAYIDGRVYLQNKENVKECTGSGPVGEPPMLKSNVCYLERDINSESIEVRKECVPCLSDFFALYRKFQAFSHLLALNECLYLDL